MQAQVVIALVVTAQGFPLAYDVMALGNTSDKTTLKDVLQQIEAQYGRFGPSLDHRPRHQHRGDVGADAHRPSTRPLLGRNAQGTAIEVRKHVPESAACKPYVCRSNVSNSWRRTRSCYVLARSHRPNPQRTCDPISRRLKIVWRTHPRAGTPNTDRRAALPGPALRSCAQERGWA